MQILTQYNKENYELKENWLYCKKSQIDMVHLFKMITCHRVFVVNHNRNKAVRQISSFQFLSPIAGSRILQYQHNAN